MSDDEKNKILEKLKSTYSELGGGKVLVSQLVHKAGGKKEDKQKILALFEVDGYDDILQMIPGARITQTKNGDSEVEIVPETSAGEAPGVPVQERVRKLLATLNAHLYGKEEAVRLALLSAVAGESVFFLGPPGTAKSMISRRISCAFKDIDREREYFEYLMNEFSTPDEICGPVSLKKLNEDQYLRLTEGYLPKAKVAFLDEIWKSGPAILNTLLTIVNEKKFHNGRMVEPVPLVSLSAASNELPERGRGLEALWDRFVLRVLVNPVASEDDFFKVVDSPAQEEPEPESQHQLGFGELEAWQDSIDGVELGDDARKVITAIRRELERRNQKLEEKEREEEGWYVSDRRWKKIVRILKASAFLNGRDTVDLMDCSLIAYCIWNTGPQQQQVDAIMEEILAEYGIDCSSAIEDLRDQLKEFTGAVDKCWFKETLKDRIVTVDGKSCYECIDPDDGSSWYVGVGGNHSVYDAQMQCQWNGQNYRYSRNGDVISCRYNFTVQKDIKLTPKSFEPAAKKANLELFTEKEFNPLLQKIEGEIKSLQDFKAENEAPFAMNAFANQQYRPILMKKIDDSIRELEDLKLELHKQQNRYEDDSNVQKEFNLGDMILQDGSWKPAGSELAEDEEILGRVCLRANYGAAFAGVYVQKEHSFNSAGLLAENFGRERGFLPPYDSGWRIPTIEEVVQIYNNWLVGVSDEKKGKVWSSSKSEGGGIRYLDIETKNIDHTTPDHEFGVILIRKLGL